MTGWHARRGACARPDPGTQSHYSNQLFHSQVDEMFAGCKMQAGACSNFATTRHVADMRGTEPRGEFRMETTSKLHPGERFTPVTFKQIDGGDYTFGVPGAW